MHTPSHRSSTFQPTLLLSLSSICNVLQAELNKSLDSADTPAPTAADRFRERHSRRGYWMPIDYSSSTESQEAKGTAQQDARRSIALSCKEGEEDVMMSLLQWTYHTGTHQVIDQKRVSTVSVANMTVWLSARLTDLLTALLVAWLTNLLAD